MVTTAPPVALLAARALPGICAEILPDLISLDDWGYPIIADWEVPRELLLDAAEAIRICPMLALRLDHTRTGD